MGSGKGQGLRRPPVDVDVVVLVCNHFHASRDAAMCALAHGNIRIDGVVIGLPDRYRTRESMRGVLLGLSKRETRVFGSRPIADVTPNVTPLDRQSPEVTTPVQSTLFG